MISREAGSAPREDREDAREVGAPWILCPVVVFTGKNVPAEKMRGATCPVCQGDLADHPIEASVLVPLDQAFAFDPSKIDEWTLGA